MVFTDTASSTGSVSSRHSYLKHMQDLHSRAIGFKIKKVVMLEYLGTTGGQKKGFAKCISGVPGKRMSFVFLAQHPVITFDSSKLFVINCLLADCGFRDEHQYVCSQRWGKSPGRTLSPPACKAVRKPNPPPCSSLLLLPMYMDILKPSAYFSSGQSRQYWCPIIFLRALCMQIIRSLAVMSAVECLRPASCHHWRLWVVPAKLEDWVHATVAWGPLLNDANLWGRRTKLQAGKA